MSRLLAVPLAVLLSASGMADRPAPDPPAREWSPVRGLWDPGTGRLSFPPDTRPEAQITDLIFAVPGDAEGPLESGRFTVDIDLSPSPHRPGLPVRLRFHPGLLSTGGTARDTRMVHERFLHVSKASDDLAWFANEHPIPEMDASWTLKITDAGRAFAFPVPGECGVFVDWTPFGGRNQVQSVRVRVPGPPQVPGASGPGTAIQAVGGGLTASLLPRPPLVADRPGRAMVALCQDGEPVSDPEPLPGASAHLAGMPHSGSGYVHAHPVPPDGSSTAPQGGCCPARPDPAALPRGPVLELPVRFGTRGAWRICVQVRRSGTPLTLPLSVTVEKGVER